MRHAINIIKVSELAETSFDNVNATLKNKLRAKQNNTRSCFHLHKNQEEGKKQYWPLKVEDNVLTQDSKRSKKVKLGAYADAARGLGAHLRDIGP